MGPLQAKMWSHLLPCATHISQKQKMMNKIRNWCKSGHFFGNGSWVAHFVKTGGGSRLLETQPPEMATSL